MVLLRGDMIGILLSVTNRGRSMARCPVAEHTPSGMMSTLEVEPAEPVEHARVAPLALVANR